MSDHSSIVKTMPRPDRSRAALVRQAAVLFRRQGYAATGINQILEAAEVKPGSLYHHFPTGKAELATAVVDTVGQDIERLLRGVLATDASIPDIVAQWIDLLARGFDGDERDGCPIEPLATESVHASPLVRAAAARAFAGWCAAIAERLIDDGWAIGPAEQTAGAVISLIEGALILSRVAGERTALESAKAAATRLLASPPPG